MTLWIVPLLPLLLGGSLWLGAPFGAAMRPGKQRVLLGSVATGGLAALLAVIPWSLESSAAAFSWGGPLQLSLQVDPFVSVLAILIPTIALPVVAWAAAHEPYRGLPRLLGLLLVFTGCMEWLVLAADLLTLSIAWELVSCASWALIGHRWRDTASTTAANYAFNATRLGGLGLWLAAGAAYATTGTLHFAALPAVAKSSWGDVMAAGVLLAAAAKSAQGPFAPWLFRAMKGPSSVSALLHSSTMVAAGAWLVIRLHEPLSAVSWFGPACIALGLTTALAGGVVAACQPHSKRLLAASTSAQYGLVFSAVGAGFAGVGLLHLVAHAAYKALLFLVAGIAISTARSEQLEKMRLGNHLPSIAIASLVGTLSLAALPPLGGAFTKERVVAATGRLDPWLGLLTILAGALSAYYATRFQLLAYGRRDVPQRPRTKSVETASVWTLAALCLGFGLVWVPGGSHALQKLLPISVPEGARWELPVSVSSVLLAGAAAAWVQARRSQQVTTDDSADRVTLANWFGLPRWFDALLITPVCSLGATCARFDNRVVQAGERVAVAATHLVSELLGRVLEPRLDSVVLAMTRGALRTATALRKSDERGIDAAVHAVAASLGRAGRRGRQLQDGSLPTYYSLIAGSLIALFALLSLWR